MIYANQALSQTDSVLILPSKIDGDVKLHISTLSSYNSEKSQREYLSIYVKNDKDDYGVNAVVGKYRLENDYLIFTPSFPFENGLEYVIRIKNFNSENSYTYQSFQVGTPKIYEIPEVIGVYPLATELPENLLRFYLYFNTPMKKGEGLRHIELVDAAGNIDNQAFMQFKQELWSADGKRLTVLFDPGRIKRGVSTNMNLGPALTEGNEYKLIISGKWKDVHGQDLAADFIKEFKVVKAYRDPIGFEDLEVIEPRESTFESLVINFDRIMDHALIQSMIQLESEDGNRVSGKWELSQDETKAIFYPEEPWKIGLYSLRMNGRLEDVSGNNLNDLLDQKLNSENNINPEELTRTITI